MFGPYSVIQYPRSPFVSLGGSIQVFLKKPIPTCDIQGGGGSGPPVPPLDPRMDVEDTVGIL